VVKQQLKSTGKHGALMTEDNLASVRVPPLSYLFPCLICMYSMVFLGFLIWRMSHTEQLVLPVTVFWSTSFSFMWLL